MSKEVLNQLYYNPAEFAEDYMNSPPKYLFGDSKLCCLLDTTNLEDMEPYQRSKLCRGLNRGIVNQKGNNGVTYKIGLDGEYLILKTVHPGSLDIVYRDQPPTGLRNFNASLEKSPTRCGFPDVDGLGYLGCDEFTNEMLVAGILDDFFSGDETPSYQGQTPGKKSNTSNGHLSGSQNGWDFHGYFKPYLRYHGSTICQDNIPPTYSGASPVGAHLMEWGDYGSLLDFVDNPDTADYRQLEKVVDSKGKSSLVEIINPEFLYIIIKQVIATLHLLQATFAFNHGDLRANNILVSSDSARGYHAGVDISGPFSCKISDYGKVSLTIPTEIGPTRIYNRSWFADRYLYMMPFKPQINIQRSGDSSREEPFFIIQDLLNVQLYSRIRHMGLPFYLSFDTYTFLMSLLSIPQYYYSFFSTPELVKKVWDPLWFGDDGRHIQDKLRLAVEKGRSDLPILDLLRGLRLRCDATQRLVMSLGSNEIPRRNEIPRNRPTSSMI